MKQLIVNAEHLQTRVALVEDGKIQEYYIEREDSNRIVGSIFKGRIKNMEDSLNAAFVDIGLEKNAFLHYWDMVPPSEEAFEDGTFQNGETATQERGDDADDDDHAADEAPSAGPSGSRGAGRSRRRRRGGSRHSGGGNDESRPPQPMPPDAASGGPAPEPRREMTGEEPPDRRQESRQEPREPHQLRGGAPQPTPTASTAERKEAPTPVSVASGLAAKLRRMFKRDVEPTPAPPAAPERPTPARSDEPRPDHRQRDRGGNARRSDRGQGRGAEGEGDRDRERGDKGSRLGGRGGSRGGDRGPRSGQERRSGGRPRSRNVNLEEIPKRFKVGTEVIVQVTKGMIGEKGPRVTTNLSIPGAYVVLMPNSSHKGVSKRIEDRKERQRLKQIINSIELPANMGVICRTASEGQGAEFLKLDVEMLMEHWNHAEKVAAKRRAPCCIYQEPSLVERSIRDLLAMGIDEIVVDSERAFQVATVYAKRLDKEYRPRVRLYADPTPIFEHFNLNDQIQRIFRRRVVLPSGSEIAIDETQALVAIDVDTARSKGKEHSETILKANLEAAEEVARQLRLRNIGGLVVVDFIDMRSKRDQMKVYQKFREHVARDRAKTKILTISHLGLLEMTRQREHESLQDAIFEPCYYCGGRGLVKSSISISVEIQRRLRELLQRNRGESQIRVTVHPSVLNRLKHEDAKILHAMEEEFGGDLSFRSDPAIHQEEFHIIDVKTGKEIF